MVGDAWLEGGEVGRVRSAAWGVGRMESAGEVHGEIKEHAARGLRGCRGEWARSMSWMAVWGAGWSGFLGKLQLMSRVWVLKALHSISGEGEVAASSAVNHVFWTVRDWLRNALAYLETSYILQRRVPSL